MKPIEIQNFLTIEECNSILKMTSNIEFINAGIWKEDSKLTFNVEIVTL